MAVAVCLLVLVPATVAAGYYLLFTLLGLGRPRVSHSGEPPWHHITVLIPAHDEEAGLPRTLQSVRSSDYPPDLLRVVVIADNCTDRTAEIAADAGAEVFVRTDPDRRGKGYALAFGLERVRADAVLILDADCEVTPGLLRACDRLLSDGAEAGQVRVVSRNADDSPAGFLAAVGAEVDHAVAVGRHRLTGRTPLRGTGMLFRRSLLKRLPWTATGLAEDAEYADSLERAKVKVRLIADEAVRCDAPAGADGLCAQRRRWRAALRWNSGWLVSKPLVLVQLTATMAMVLVFGQPLFVAWAGLLLVATAWVYGRAVRRVGLTGRRWADLCRTPLLVARLGWIAVEGLWKTERGWYRTVRR
jgi:1,2-diacylglycerol 3-beta-glucosyltransferase